MDLHKWALSACVECAKNVGRRKLEMALVATSLFGLSTIQKLMSGAYASELSGDRLTALIAVLARFGYVQKAKKAS